MYNFSFKKGLFVQYLKKFIINPNKYFIRKNSFGKRNEPNHNNKMGKKI